MFSISRKNIESLLFDDYVNITNIKVKSKTAPLGIERAPGTGVFFKEFYEPLLHTNHQALLSTQLIGKWK